MDCKLSICQGVRNHVELGRLHFGHVLISPVEVDTQKSIAYWSYESLEAKVHQYSKKHRSSSVSAFRCHMPSTMIVPHHP